jgi:hypothetical protein
MELPGARIGVAGTLRPQGETEDALARWTPGSVGGS